MSKLRVKGTAEMEFSADTCRIYITIQEKRKISSMASKSMSEQLESILGKLQKLGIQPEKIELTSDRLERCSCYDSNDEQYQSERGLSFCIPADVKTVNRIRDVVEDGFDSVLMNTEYFISDDKNNQREVLLQAMKNSRLMAEAIAEADGKKITGIKAADLNGDEWEELYGESEPCPQIWHKKKESLSDRLQPEKIKLSAEVNVVWLCS